MWRSGWTRGGRGRPDADLHRRGVLPRSERAARHVASRDRTGGRGRGGGAARRRARGSSAAALAHSVGARHIADAGFGVSRARNIAWRAAAGEVILFTDDDCAVPPAWLSDHLAALADPANGGSFGVVSGLARDAGPDPAERTAVHRAGSPPWDVGHASNMAVRTAVLADVGGFDERIGPGSRGVPAGEDADLIFRLLSGGHLVLSGVGAPVTHLAWRSADDHAALLRSYEAGAGVWIGAALRARRPYARRHLKQRTLMLLDRVRPDVRAGRLRRPLRLAFALLAGLVRGLLLEAWPVEVDSDPRDGQSSSATSP